MIHHVTLPRPKTIDHRETFTRVWAFTNGDTEGEPIAAGNFTGRSLQTDGPCLIEATNDEKTWFTIMKADGPCLVPITTPARCIRPRAIVGKPVTVAIFLCAP